MTLAVFATDDELHAWLEGQPREVGIAIAARAAWRVLPLAFSAQIHSAPVRLIETLRGCASAILALNLSLGSPATSAAYEATQQGSEDWMPFRGAAFAASALKPASTFAAFQAAQSSANWFGATVLLEYAGREALAAQHVSNAGRLANYRDTEAISNGTTSPQRLTMEPLWLGGIPALIERLQNDTLSVSSRAGDGFDIWFEWYEMVLAGDDRLIFPAMSGVNRNRRPKTQDRLRGEYDRAFARAINDLDLWKKSPAEINAQIRAWVEEERAFESKSEEATTAKASQSKGARRSKSSKPVQRPTPKTSRGKAILENAEVIVLQAGLVLAQIEVAIEHYEKQLPNHPDKQAEKEGALIALRDLKAKVEELLKSVDAFKNDQVSEANVIEKSNAFLKPFSEFWAESGKGVVGETVRVGVLGCGFGLAALMKVPLDPKLCALSLAAVVAGGPLGSLLKAGKGLIKIGGK